jgi:MFS family permease
MAHAADGGRTPWRAVAMLAVSETVAWGALYYSFGALLRPFASGLAVSGSVVAGAFSVALLASAGAAWAAGAGIDRWGPRTIMTLGALAGAAALAALATVDGPLGLYAAWAVIGVSQASTLYEPAFAAVAKWVPAPKERALSLLVITSVAGFASTIFVPLTALLAAQFGRRGASLVLAVLMAAVVVPLNAALPRTKGTPSKARPAARSPKLVPLAIVFALQAFASAGVSVHLVSHLCDAGHGIGAAATIAGLTGAAQVPARLVFQRFQRLAPERARLPILLGAQALALSALLSASPVIATVGALLFGAANGLMTLERAVIVAESFPSEEYGAVNGRIATFAQASRAAAPIAVGLLRGMSASYASAFLALVVCTLVASVVAWRSVRVSSAGR